MDRKASIDKEKVDPERMEVLRGLPIEIKQQITGEEARAFLHKEPLPDTLIEKLKGYLDLDE
ncbi:hypothetical protein [Desulfopila inferna]|uniref:hypothetical protein n=1 Tax=Desulfopila inferna TaxID=468528 RepID=UPI00196321AE|nr:hypothetical protein [Desulfopila inferna]MBM9604934.1 hypothetical protein [Desulfopila inferna]